MAGSNGCSPNVIMSQQGIIQQPAKEKKPHIKKPLNAFMLFMKEKRQEVIKEHTLKESAAINQILGKMVWNILIKHVCSVCVCFEWRENVVMSFLWSFLLWMLLGAIICSHY